MKLWKLGTTDLLSPTTYNDGDKYTAIGNFTVVVVQNDDVYFCGAPYIGFNGFSITLQLYDLPRFHASNKPKVSDSQSDKLTVTWNKWTTDDIGDGPVESYKVYYRESGESDWISGEVIPVSDSSQMSYTSTITGLQWSTEYEITVTVKRPGPLGEGNKDTTITETTLCATPQAPIIHQVSSPELNQLEVHVQVSAFTGAGMGEYSDVASIQTTETIPGQLSSIYVLSATENSITVNWTDPVIFSGEIETYGITYKSLHSVYSSTAPVSKDLLVTEPPPYTLKGLPAATQFEISVNASTSKGFGEHKTIISGTKIVIDDISVILVPVVVTAPVLTETTATINLRKFDDNVDINKDTEQMKYVVVVEEKHQQQKRDLEENQYIIALFPLNEIPDQLIVGDVYDGFAVYTTGKEEYIIEKLIEFTAGAVSDPGTSTDTSSGIIGGVIAAVLIVAVVIALVFVLKRRQQNAKTGKKYEEAQMQSTHDENAYANVDESRRAYVDGAKWKESSQQNVVINPIKDGDTGELQYMKPERSVKPSKPPKPAVVPLAKFVPVKSIPPKPIIKSRLNSQHVIKIDDLADYIIKKRKENKFVEEYKLLPQSTGTIPHEAAKNPDNKQKNRFRNVLSYDHSRVVLDVINDDPNSDYINANYIDGYQKHKAFIATQGPNGLTVVDFWRMIVQENVTTILMATNLAESGKIKCVQYWPEKGSMKYGSVSVTLEKTKAFPEYSLRTFTVKQGNTVEREVRHFHFTVWPDMSVPIYATGVLNMLEHVNSINDANSGPIVVHCSAGVGRTGSFISIDSMLKMAKAEGCIDVFNFVKRGRENRMNFVQTAEQYEFIHTAVLEAILCGDTSISASDFRLIYGKLQIVDKKTKKSQLQVQWENLGKVSREPRADECEVGTLEENSDKNRFHNVLPFDRRRLRLMTPVYDDDFSTDYVNASFVSAYTVKEAFMVTQMPLPNTIVDLWRMVYDYKSTSIVMLNDMDHNDKTLGQYWPDEGAMQCGPFLVETMKTDKMPNITTRTMHLTNTAEVASLQFKCVLYVQGVLATALLSADTSSAADVMETQYKFIVVLVIATVGCFIVTLNNHQNDLTYEYRYSKSPRVLTDGNKSSVRVLVLASYRSGSTFVSELFRQNEHFFSLFEPGYVLAACLPNNEKKKTIFSVRIIELLRDIYTCAFKSLYARCYVTAGSGGFSVKNAMSRTSGLQEIHVDDVIEYCNKREHTAVKTIRVKYLNDVVPLIRDSDVNLKVLHLIRDPRGKFSSIRKLHKGQFTLEKVMEMVNQYCNVWARNIAVGNDARTWLQHKYKTIRYEDLSQHPITTATEIYQFLGLELPDNVRSWLHDNTAHTSDGTFGTSRNSNITSTAWRNNLSFNEVQQVQSFGSCQQMMKWAGYKIANSHEEMMNLNVSLVVPNIQLNWTSIGTSPEYTYSHSVKSRWIGII
ncbi:receptor-type tyrosine-protein phosphatase T-like [Saccoglossus kowalevskii]